MFEFQTSDTCASITRQHRWNKTRDVGSFDVGSGLFCIMFCIYLSVDLYSLFLYKFSFKFNNITGRGISKVWILLVKSDLALSKLSTTLNSYIFFFSAVELVLIWSSGLCVHYVLAACPFLPPPHRSVRYPRRGHGEAVLSQMHGRLHTKVLQAPPHRWSVFRHWLPPHALHGSSRVQAQEARQPVCPEVSTVVHSWRCTLVSVVE